jgi:hypothetical protein
MKTCYISFEEALDFLILFIRTLYCNRLKVIAFKSLYMAENVGS